MEARAKPKHRRMLSTTENKPSKRAKAYHDQKDDGKLESVIIPFATAWKNVMQQILSYLGIRERASIIRVNRVFQTAVKMSLEPSTASKYPCSQHLDLSGVRRGYRPTRTAPIRFFQDIMGNKYGRYTRIVRKITLNQCQLFHGFDGGVPALPLDSVVARAGCGYAPHLTCVETRYASLPKHFTDDGYDRPPFVTHHFLKFSSVARISKRRSCPFKWQASQKVLKEWQMAAHSLSPFAHLGVRAWASQLEGITKDERNGLLFHIVDHLPRLQTKPDTNRNYIYPQTRNEDIYSDIVVTVP
eukprot:jgi/Bigna1/147348/aug1.142_g22056